MNLPLHDSQSFLFKKKLFFTWRSLSHWSQGKQMLKKETYQSLEKDTELNTSPLKLPLKHWIVWQQPAVGLYSKEEEELPWVCEPCTLTSNPQMSFVAEGWTLVNSSCLPGLDLEFLVAQPVLGGHASTVHCSQNKDSLDSSGPQWRHCFLTLPSSVIPGGPC